VEAAIAVVVVVHVKLCEQITLPITTRRVDSDLGNERATLKLDSITQRPAHGHDWLVCFVSRNDENSNHHGTVQCTMKELSKLKELFAHVPYPIPPTLPDHFSYMDFRMAKTEKGHAS